MGQFLDMIKSIARLHGHMDVGAAAESIKNNIYFRGPNVYILFFAIVIASLGLNVNSIPVIIGAMLVSPLMGPIVGLGLSLGTNDTDLLRASLRNLAVMVIISIVASTLYFLLTPLRLENPTELLARTNPTIYDVLIALFGGFAGIFETCRKEKGTVLAGVAIATALMPPLCTIGYGLAQLNMNYAVGALYLFFINSVFIALATFIGVKYLRFPAKTYRDPDQERRIRRVTFVLLIIIIIPSVLSAVSIVKENNFERSVQALVSDVRRSDNVYVYDYHVDHNSKPLSVELYVAGVNDSSYKEKIYSMAEEREIMRSQIVFKSMATQEQSRPSDKLLTELLSQQALQREQQDSLVRSMQSELDSYRQQELPYRILADEIRSQYPSLLDVTLTQGSVVMADGEMHPQVVVLVNGKGTHSIGSDEVAKLERWLRVRLEGRSVKVVVE
ncbi:MAG: TIGR00341 family protein [Bacteroidales bacterium]|nr:TIGR00341 family protein [Bacteroidales bacterium]